MMNVALMYACMYVLCHGLNAFCVFIRDAVKSHITSSEIKKKIRFNVINILHIEHFISLHFPVSITKIINSVVYTGSHDLFWYH